MNEFSMEKKKTDFWFWSRREGRGGQNSGAELEQNHHYWHSKYLRIFKSEWETIVVKINFYYNTYHDTKWALSEEQSTFNTQDPCPDKVAIKFACCLKIHTKKSSKLQIKSQGCILRFKSVPREQKIFYVIGILAHIFFAT